MNDTYPLILTTRILRALQWVTMAVGNDGGGVRDVIPDARNDGMGVRNGMTNGGSSYARVCCKFLLEPES